MEINWDFLISAVILIWLFLVIAAKMTHQKVPELLEGLRDFITGAKDDTLERGEEILLYNE